VPLDPVYKAGLAGHVPVKVQMTKKNEENQYSIIPPHHYSRFILLNFWYLAFIWNLDFDI
jgi:hypothetical protein